MIRVYIQRMGRRDPKCMLERLDPRCKLIIVFVMTIMIFMATPAVSFGMFAVVGIIAFIAKVRLFFIFSTLASAMIWLVFYLLFNYVLNRPLDEPQSLFYGIVFRGVSLTVLGVCFAVTTKPKDLTAAFEAWRVPQVITLPLAIALRFVPTLFNEAMIIRDAMRLRKIAHRKIDIFTKPNLIWQSYFALVIIRSLKMADELAAVAETRGFGMGNFKSPVSKKFAANDYFAIALTAATVAMILVSCFLVENL